MLINGKEQRTEISMPNISDRSFEVISDQRCLRHIALTDPVAEYQITAIVLIEGCIAGLHFLVLHSLPDMHKELSICIWHLRYHGKPTITKVPRRPFHAVTHRGDTIRTRENYSR